MRISHYNTFSKGGAATAAIRIHHELKRQGVASTFCFHRGSEAGEDDPTFQPVTFDSPRFEGLRGIWQRRRHRKRQKEIFRQFQEHLASRPDDSETFSMACQPTPTFLDGPHLETDVAHLHWIAFFADYPSFFQSLPDKIPLVWTLHDMNPFTGGCHYSDGCTQFRFGCGDCPQVMRRRCDDVSMHSFEAKRNALRNKKITVVTPSQWLGNLAKRSPIWPADTRFETIRLGFDLQTFRPIDRQAARRKLGLPRDAILVGFGAENVDNRRKGIRHLLAAFRHIHVRQNTGVRQPRIEGLLFGSGVIAPEDRLPPLHQMGFVDTAERQALIYSASDLVVVPSREDNQPQVGLEAMACGIPVIGFDVGGIPEYVREGETGLCVPVGDESRLAERIIWLAQHPEARQAMGDRARAMMVSEFEIVSQTKKYLELYRDLLASNRAIPQAA